MNDKTVYSYIKDVVQRLKEPRKHGDVPLMVGAGFLKNAQSKGMAGTTSERSICGCVLWMLFIIMSAVKDKLSSMPYT